MATLSKHHADPSAVSFPCSVKPFYRLAGETPCFLQKPHYMSNKAFNNFLICVCDGINVNIQTTFCVGVHPDSVGCLLNRLPLD